MQRAHVNSRAYIKIIMAAIIGLHCNTVLKNNRM